MPLDAEVSAKYDMAADVARQDIHKILDAMTPEERKGAEKIISWMKKHFMAATFKRLGHIITREV